MKLELAILAGAESKAFLADLTTQIDRLEKLTSGKSIKDIENESEIPEETYGAEDEVEDDDFGVKPTKNAKKSQASVFEDEEDDSGVEELNFKETAKAPKAAPKKAKAKKVTLDDVNDACMARAMAGGKNGFKEVKGILKKKFKTESISELEESQYQECIDAMAVEQ